MRSRLDGVKLAGPIRAIPNARFHAFPSRTTSEPLNFVGKLRGKITEMMDFQPLGAVTAGSGDAHFHSEESNNER